MKAPAPAVVENGPSTSYALNQLIRYEYSAPVANLRQNLVVVPVARHGQQRRRRWTIDVSGASAVHRRARRDSFGNLVIEVAVPSVASSVTFEVRATVTAGPSAPAGPHRIRPDHRYLAPTIRTSTEGASSLRSLARGTRDAATICHRVHESLTYEWGITGVHTTAAEAVAGGRGVCQDFAHVMLAACRANGVPARYVSGHLTGEGGSHAWVEVLQPDPARAGSWTVEGWDPTHDRAVGDGYLTVAVGRDYADVAPLSGTFEGTGQGVLTVEKRLTSTLL